MKKFRINFTFILMAICFIFSPYQTTFFKLLICLIIHELGHIFFMNYFKIKINSINIYGFGALIDCDNKSNSFIEDLFIYLGGIIFNITSLIFLPDEFKKYTYIIIIFNILPIYPLDGFRVILCLFSYFIRYKIALYISYIISILSIIISFIFIINSLDFLVVFNLFYLIFINIIELKNINKSYNLFTLDRYLNSYSFKYRRIKFRENLIDSLYKYHLIYFNLNDKRINEVDILKLKYL